MDCGRGVRAAVLLLDAPTSAEKRRARCDPGLDVLERGEADGLEGGTSETTGGAVGVGGGATVPASCQALGRALGLIPLARSTLALGPAL